jgi:hypothetical protein
MSGLLSDLIVPAIFIGLFIVAVSVVWFVIRRKRQRNVLKRDFKPGQCWQGHPLSQLTAPD